MTAERPTTSRWFETALLALLPFLGWWQYGLFDLDEGFYGAVVGEMNRRHEWVTPYFNGHPWFEKPILLYWAAKPCVALFGDLVGPRLPSILASLLTIFLVARFASKHISPFAGQVGVLALSGSLFFVGVGRQMMCDPLLVLCLTGAFMAFWESLDGRTTLNRGLAGLCVGLAVLAKGPVSLILVPAVLLWTYWREPDLRSRFRGGWLAFWAALALAIASWYVPIYLANPHGFVKDFLIDQNLKRFVGGDDAHNGGLATLPLYAIVLLVGMAPFSVYALRNWPRRRSSDPLNRYLAAWAGIIFIFFTISGTKLVHYVLPCCPPLALLAAHGIARGSASKEPKKLYEIPGLAAMSLFCALAAQLGFTFWYAKSGMQEAHTVARYVRQQGPGNVAVYQMPRREHDLGTLKLKLKETSLPSLLLYLDRDVVEAEHFEDLLHAPQPIWVITRVGRLTDDDVDKATQLGYSLSEVPLPNLENFALYALRPSSPAAPRRDRDGSPSSSHPHRS